MKIKAFQKDLLNWFYHHKRKMPWRNKRTPYRVWISEVMLQQTQVVTVIPYYQKWMKRFPTIKKLAEAPLDDVLKHWEGLGYYTRARNIHKAAEIIVTDHQGKFPQTYEEILKLPGIGPYSAAAISSIAYGLPQAVLDGNVIRVLTRLFTIKENTSLPKTKKDLWLKAEEILDKKNPGDFNEAIMELGALICTPTKPSCLLCPISKHCLANQKGTQEKYPIKTKTQYENLDVVVGILWDDKKRVLIQKRPTNKRFGGLWEFPGGKVEKNETLKSALKRELQEELSIQTEILKKRKTINHAYTKFRVKIHAYDCKIKSGKPTKNAATHLKWVTISELSKHAFPSANIKLIKELTA